MSRWLPGFVVVLLLAPPVARAQTVTQLQTYVERGELARAETGYLSLVEREPRNAEAWVGLARLRRTSGRPLAAEDAASRAVELAPLSAMAQEELAAAYVAQGQPWRAERFLESHGTQGSAELQAHVRAQPRWDVDSGTVGVDDSNGVSKLNTRLVASARLPLDARLSAGGGLTWLRQGSWSLRRQVAGVALTVPFGRASLDGGWGIYQGVDTLMQEAKVGVKYRPLDGFAVGLSARRRPFLEVAEPLATDDRAFFAAGAGGALLLADVSRRAVDELKLNVSASPARWMYLYAEAVGSIISDWNQAGAVAAGTGVNVLGFFERPLPVDLFLRWDTYVAGYTSQRVAYFSPPFMDGQSPSAEVRLRLGWTLELGADGGRTFSAFTPGAGGWFGGAVARLNLGMFQAAVRAQLRNDPWVSTRKLWVELKVVP